jgi:hypothetical protein
MIRRYGIEGWREKWYFAGLTLVVSAESCPNGVFDSECKSRKRVEIVIDGVVGSPAVIISNNNIPQSSRFCLQK